MKSNKQRRAEIMSRRQKRAKRLTGLLKNFRNRHLLSIEANHERLIHNSYYCDLPSIYIDKPFKCRDCNTIEVWTAKRQKWWYEVAKGRIESTAIYCRGCRAKRRTEKEIQKAHMAEMTKTKPHPYAIFFKKRK